MSEITIDGRRIAVEPGTTVLDAAGRLGIPIPTLCHLPGTEPFTSCMACVVRNVATGRFLPACSAPVTDGMVVETDTPGVREERRKVLELLLSEHAGDCEAPCALTCPARLDIPRMIRHIAAGDGAAALATVLERIALPGVLGYVCPAPCEKACRRGARDAPVAICALKRFAAEGGGDGGSRAAEGPQARVAIIGAGAAGLAAAYYLARLGHGCVVFDEREAPGGQLRYGVPRERLPLPVLEADIDRIRRAGVEFRLRTRIEPGAGLRELKAGFAAVVLATGGGGAPSAWGLDTEARGIQIERGTFRTSDPRVFAGGDVARATGRLAVRAVAQGRAMAVAADHALRGQPVVGPPRRYEARMGRLRAGEIDVLMQGAAPGSRVEPGSGMCYAPDEARRESRRCLRCDCRKADVCRLRAVAEGCGVVSASVSVADRLAFTRDTTHPHVVYEAGKCIKCGICARIVGRSGRTPGLAFMGRGYEARVGVPFGDSWARALGDSAEACVNACPTGALAWR
jgi:ferredoxin